MQRYLVSKTGKISLDVSLIIKTKKQLGFNGIKNINKYLKNLAEIEMYENNKLLVSVFHKNIKNDNKSLIAKPVTFSYYMEDFTKIKKEDDNSPLNRDETDEIEEANSDDFNNDDE